MCLRVAGQGRCGSCWSFATAGALEGMHYRSGCTSCSITATSTRSSGHLVSLSEQQLLDCSAPWGNQVGLVGEVLVVEASGGGSGNG